MTDPGLHRDTVTKQEEIMKLKGTSDRLDGSVVRLGGPAALLEGQGLFPALILGGSRVSDALFFWPLRVPAHMRHQHLHINKH